MKLRERALLHWVSYLLGVGAGGFAGGIRIEGTDTIVARVLLLTIVVLIGLGWAFVITGGGS